MPETIDAFTQMLRGLPASDRLAASAAAADVPRLRINAHVHLPPNFSAFETTAQAVALADAQGVRVLGASNYYDYAVYADFAVLAEQNGIFPLFGLETICLIDDLVQSGVKINDPGNAGKMYLCGKGITQFAPMTPTAAGLLQTIRDNDGARMATIADRLSAIFADAGITTGLDADAIKARVAARHGCPVERVYLQERHLAQAFQEVVFEKVAPNELPTFWERVFGGAASKAPDSAVGIQNEIRSYLMKAGKSAFVPDTFVDFDHAYRLILALGGIPCYPTLADGALPITPFESSPEALAASLRERGIPAAEFIPNRNAPETLRRYVRAMRDAGLFVTAGTEHNTLDLLPLEPTCLNDAPIPDDLAAIFREGACVVAAHQYLILRGEAGFIDKKGALNINFLNNDARIRHFAAIGAGVFAAYSGK